ncbi:MAG: helix-turn-helix domain-containing protein [Candidatus Competibacter sp.]|jgi:transposase|nr:helix-turn-helix domain containing protein [Candidatus Competibacteraceae bacterium]
MKRIRSLSDAECETLRAAWKGGPNGRVRQRAQAVYLAHRGYRRIALSGFFEVDVDTISAWLDGWERDGLCGLYDGPRSGRPRIYTAGEEARLCGWLDEEPRQIQQAQARLEQATGKPASRQTAHRIVKKKRIAGSGADGGLTARATKPPFARRTSG